VLPVWATALVPLGIITRSMRAHGRRRPVAGVHPHFAAKVLVVSVCAPTRCATRCRRCIHRHGLQFGYLVGGSILI